MSTREIRIATRKSALALWQAEYVKARLEQAHPGLLVTLVPMVSRGDKLLDAPLAKIGGKGLFVKELETALLDNEADIAVHSMKDVPMDFPEGLGLYCICEREDRVMPSFPIPLTALKRCLPAASSALPACAARPSCWRAARTCKSASCGATSIRAWPSWTPASTTPSSSPPPADPPRL